MLPTDRGAPRTALRSSSKTTLATRGMRNHSAIRGLDRGLRFPGRKSAKSMIGRKRIPYRCPLQNVFPAGGRPRTTFGRNRSSYYLLYHYSTRNHIVESNGF